MIPNNVQNRADAVFNIIDAKQDQYFAKNGKYFQSLRQGAGPYQDNVPEDESNPDDRVLVINGNNPFEMEINESVGPDGASYTVRFIYLADDGKQYQNTYSKAGNTGWEEYFTNV